MRASAVDEDGGGGAGSAGIEGRPRRRPSAVVVGGGWAGFGAMKALSAAGWDVELLDAMPDPASMDGGMATESGRPVEPGFKGFWYQYPNINGLAGELGIPEYDLFSPYTRSGFYTPSGLFAEAPVFSELPRLPAPLGQALYTLPLFRGVPIADRLSLSGLLVEMARYKASPETYRRYDRMSAQELFDRIGFSKFLVDKFVTPFMMVSLFAPPKDLSAAVVLDMLYFYAMGHQSDVDVRWSRKPISESLLNPMVRKIQSEAKGTNTTAIVRGNSLVSEVLVEDGRAKGVIVRDKLTGTQRRVETDAVILAVGVGGLKKIVEGSPQLASRSPDLRRCANLRTLDVISTRLWLDKKVLCPFPSNILADFAELEGAGATFFCLDALQDDPWGPVDAEFKGSVIAADFYGASKLSALPDEEIVRRLTEVMLPAAVPAFASVSVKESWVMRFPNAVTHFSPGSAPLRPPQEIPEVGNLVLAGDFVRDLEHGSAGLSQERAYVAGLNAGNLLINKLGGIKVHSILEIEEAEPQFKAAVEVAKRAEDVENIFRRFNMI